MHRSSPHGPCEPSARLTGRAQTYVTDLPKRDSMLPEAASERDQHSPHIRVISPTIRACSCTIVTWMQPYPKDPELSTPSYDATLPIPHGLCLWCTAIGYDQSPPVAHGRPPLLSIPGRSLAPDGPTAYPTPTHRTRQRISRHSPSPTSHDTLTSRGETIRFSPFLSTRAPTNATTRPCLELQTYSEVVWPYCASHAPRDNWSPQQRRPFSCHICTPMMSPAPWKHLRPTWHLWKRGKLLRRYKREHI
jgi:hypothetical protein